AEDGIRDGHVTGVQTCALPISGAQAVTPRALSVAGVTMLLGLAFAGCDALPGRPRPADRERLPSQAMAFSALYGDNCAACHGVRSEERRVGKEGRSRWWA